MVSPSETELDVSAPQKHWSLHDLIWGVRPAASPAGHDDGYSDFLFQLPANEHKQVASGLSI